MNKRRLIANLSAFSRGRLPAFAVLAGLFAVGVLLGTAMSGPYVSGGGAAEYLGGFSTALESGELGWDTARVFIKLAGFHILAFLLGFSMLGVVLIPALAFLRGFSVAFTLAVLTKTCAVSGVVSGYILLGIPALVAIPLFFLIAAEALCAGAGLIRAGLFHDVAALDIFDGAYFIRFLVTLLILLLLAAGESALVGLGALELPIL